jgi:1-acyl-sn-glycerol-3-phosphate acyltransferase
MEREQLVKSVLPVLQAIRLYHRHEVVGMERMPLKSRVLVVVNHSLATYDITLLMTAFYVELKRLPRPLIDRLFFKIPYLGDLTQHFGAVQGSPEAARQLLESDEIVTVAPGGMKEALRPSSERYQIRWEKRYGFVKLAMETRSPVVLAACPKADDLYDVYENPVTDYFYKRFKVPVFLARGLGPTPLPRPVKLVHLLSEPMEPPEPGTTEREHEKRAKIFHARLVKRMHELIGEAIQYRP